MTIRLVFAIGAFVCAVAFARTAIATEPMPLPDFELTALDGRSIRTQELASNGKWLLIYVQPNCRPCDVLLKLVTEPEFSALAGRLVIVVGGASAGEAASMAARFPDLAGAGWYAHRMKMASVQMKAAGSPVAFGILQSTVVWNLNGVLPDPVRMKSILKSWIEQ